MTALNSDNLRKGAPNFSTKLTADIEPTDTEIILQSVAGLPLDTAVTLTIDATDANGNPTPANKETVTGVVNAGASTLVNVIRGLDNTTAQAHADGANIVQWFTANDWNDFITTFLQEHSQSGNHNSPPPGSVVMFGGASAPTGWLLADGSAVSRTTYAALFAAIGTSYGVGDGSTTFNLPSLSGKVPVGYKGGDANFGTLGATGGEVTHVLTAGEMPSHNHTINAVSGGGGSTFDSIGNTGNGAQIASALGVSSAGGGGAHNNLQPFIVLNYLVKT